MLSNKIEENGARLWWSKNLLLKTHHCLECTSNGIFSANCYKLLKLPRFNTFLVQHPGCIQDIPRRRSRASSPWTLITAIFWLHFRGNHPGYRRFNFDSPVSSLCRASGPSSWDQHFALAHGEGEMAFFEPIRRWQEGGSERNWRQLESKRFFFDWRRHLRHLVAWPLMSPSAHMHWSHFGPSCSLQIRLSQVVFPGESWI